VSKLPNQFPHVATVNNAPVDHGPVAATANTTSLLKGNTVAAMKHARNKPGKPNVTNHSYPFMRLQIAKEHATARALATLAKERSMRTVSITLAGCALQGLCLAQLPQPAARKPVTLSAGVEVGSPIGEFNSSFGKEMFGLSGNLSVPWRVLPLEWGVDVGWCRMGSAASSVEVNNEFLQNVQAELQVNSNITSVHGHLRFSPLQGPVRPYVDGMAGLRIFSTRSEVTAEGIEGNISSTTEASSWAGSYGWAGGLMVGFGPLVYAEARVERWESGRVSYVDPESITISEQGNVGFSTLYSGTSTFNFYLGLGLSF
jgi:hypothetical protein